ncbi:Multidrug resistance-associated protein 1 [Trichinella pseudospiralis]|uniref:ABC-type glutathione-S-conjugate transporter n=1 Tax=Trichinella pseudospiralis TaxID=6337 RepID=A0A0V1E234_TRIPS|nr:Multidrug resistance-associated protein 1 [Trichinella pseudospiralis]KRZ21426.1 Multidrug resistance-associated protein 1 [Trichinella pseudospiralis]
MSVKWNNSMPLSSIYGIERFCGEPLWNPEIVNSTTFPEFTSCFRNTVLVWIPLFFLAVLTPLQLCLCLRSRHLPLPFRPLLVLKFIIACALVIATAVCWISMLILKKSGQRNIYDADFVGPLLLCISMIPSEEMVPRMSYLVYYVLLVIQWFFWCWADKSAPYETVDKNSKVCPEYKSSFLNQMLFEWFTVLPYRGWREPLTQNHIWNLTEDYLSKSVVSDWEARWTPKMKKYWKEKAAAVEKTYEVNFRNQKVQVIAESKKLKMPAAPSVIKTLFQCHRWTFFTSLLLKFAADTIQFASPQILSLLIKFVENTNEPVWKGYFYSVLMFASAVVFTVLTQYHFHMVYQLAIKVRSMLVSALFTKSLRLSNAARRQSTIGEVVNLMSVDVQRFTDVVLYISMIVSAPYQILLSVYFLWDVIGASVLSGVGFLILLIPLNYFISSKQNKLQVSQMKYKDERMKLINEILNGIKVLKLYAWELAFGKQVNNIRKKELDILKTASYYRAATSFIWTCAPFLVAVVVFTTYVLSSPDNILTPTTAFVSLSLLNILRFPMSVLPMLISFVVQALVSNKRIKRFLIYEELNMAAVDRNANQDDAIKVTDGEFAWDDTIERPTLQNINFSIKPGELVAVVGQVGAGKSSFLSAILGEMEKRNGTVGIKGSVAYVPQQAWIQNMTVRENILFNKPYRSDLMKKVLDGCSLNRDLQLLSGGEEAEIGEKGVNLSGGQRQRISLARAVYQNADIYLLDDPLSAVDSHVGQHIFENVISNNGLLKNKTRVFVTHGLGYLKDADKIIVLNNGTISEIGTYNELLSRKGAFAKLIETYIQERNEDEAFSDDVIDEIIEDAAKVDLRLYERSISSVGSDGSRKRVKTSNQFDTDDYVKDYEKEYSKMLSSKKKQNEGKLIQEEEAAVGNIKAKVYLDYIKAIGFFSTFAITMLYITSNGFSVGASFWLADWSYDANRYANETTSTDVRLGIYASLGILQGIFILLATTLLSYSMVLASRDIHESLLNNLLRSPMSFYDVTPLGRILNRIGKDIDVIDDTLPLTVRTWIMAGLGVLSVLLVILISTPIFAAVIVPIAILYYFLQKIYIRSSRQLKRIESITRSPVYSHFQESLTGAAVIRAFQVQERFIFESERRLDENQTSFYQNEVSNRWLAVRLELIGNFLVLMAALFAVISREDKISAGIVGLSVSYALQITQSMNYAVRMTGDLETNIVAVERTNEYMHTPTEAALTSDERLPNDWPTNGTIQFSDYKLRYREGLELCLKGITCFIRGGEKIGIVGRTGAGKSSLTLALFRIVEPAGGSLLIDNTDITKIGLHDLRSRLTIIPQEPVLFCGTLRINLDPYDAYSDQDIWRNLERAHLKAFVSSLPDKLQHRISEGGENLSVGQRQLVCLARALLRKTKILILDEATAAVDLETDDLIQQTIRLHFSDCTVLTIAHRLNTIIDNDRIMVLDAGRIAEFEPPQQLLNNKNSIFYSMAKDAGLV